ncbi:hypothetical protein [Reichenbachiella versicolor]|uniref:hypothetical protein n=1 Tax=Reichenbachiella versicolor TaxID=1821036 RepID=UPI0013A5593F|nr:hypothetical protein [Reichenbachiella versicolor]
MLHLISIQGESARDFFMESALIPDFKALLRAITSGRVMIIPTRFRSDLIYNAESCLNSAIIKLWALYTGTCLSDIRNKDIQSIDGDKPSLNSYFEDMNALSSNWYRYRTYRKEVFERYDADRYNPVIQTVLSCDKHLTSSPLIHRKPLINDFQTRLTLLNKDTFTLAMKLIKSGVHEN